jgi:hypothetical protein
LGGLSPRLLGLSNIDWFISLGLGLGLLFVMLLLLMLVRATTSIPTRANPLASIEVTTWFYQLVQQGAEEFHWCFLRGALWELIQTAPTPPALPGYWAVWLAALLAAPEALFWSRGTAQRLLTLIVLIGTTVLFFYTHNFWLCWLLHASAWFIVNPQRTPATAAT